MTEADTQRMVSDCMEIIGYTGEGRSFVYEAVGLLIEDKLEAALAVIEKAEDCLAKAHEIQFLRIMSRAAMEPEIPCNIILLHAMDILMASTSEKDMIKAILNAKLKLEKRRLE